MVLRWSCPRSPAPNYYTSDGRFTPPSRPPPLRITAWLAVLSAALTMLLAYHFSSSATRSTQLWSASSTFNSQGHRVFRPYTDAPEYSSRLPMLQRAEYVTGESGRQILKPTKAAPPAPMRRLSAAQSLAERLEWQKQFEITDNYAKEIAADLIRQVTMVFFIDPSSPWHTDPTKLKKPERRRKQENVDADEILPIPFPRDLPGLEWIPSRIAFAVYNRGVPVGVAIVIDKLIDYGTNIHIIATYHVEHDMLRSMIIGQRGNTMKQLVLVMNEQLTIQYQRPVTVQLYVEPTLMWSKLIGGIWRFMPY